MSCNIMLQYVAIKRLESRAFHSIAGWLSDKPLKSAIARSRAICPCTDLTE